ncbi:unnamed protein product [Urochloa humidicola]
MVLQLLAAQMLPTATRSIRMTSAEETVSFGHFRSIRIASNKRRLARHKNSLCILQFWEKYWRLKSVASWSMCSRNATSLCDILENASSKL